MIDWSTTLLEVDAKHLKTDRILRISADGDQIWTTDCWDDVPSYTTSIRLRRSAPTASMMEFAASRGRVCPSVVLAVSGNPIKWLQNHNAAGPGPEYHIPLWRRVIARLDRDLYLPEDLPAAHRGRMDIAVSFRLGSDCRSVHDWIQTAALHSRSRQGTAIRSGTTVYWNRASRRWSMKAYCKHCELKAHQCKLEPVIEYAEGLLRVELTLRGQELRQYGTLRNDIIWEYYRRLSMSKQTSRMDDLMIDQLGRAAQNTYYRWRDGLDMKTRLPERTYYRHRREIYKALGVDISAPYSPPSDDSITDDFSQAKLESVQEPNRPQSLVDQSLLLDL